MRTRFPDIAHVAIELEDDGGLDRPAGIVLTAPRLTV